ITLLAHTDGVDAAKAFVELVRAEHPDARHHCVAWVAGAPDDSNGFYECVLVGALFLVVHMVIGNIMEPRMMGHRLGMSTLVVFL
ncbi:hypothetical protein ONQ97_26380, partial [Salmonella enterica subsp. enterica serovar Virginia]|nr:hypothetical protein [Salmonella enterica subsp. enterica serovar Virginia]